MIKIICPQCNGDEINFKNDEGVCQGCGLAMAPGAAVYGRREAVEAKRQGVQLIETGLRMLKEDAE